MVYEMALLQAYGAKAFWPQWRNILIPRGLSGALCRNRTYNLVIKSHLLCQLS